MMTYNKLGISLNTSEEQKIDLKVLTTTIPSRGFWEPRLPLRFLIQISVDARPQRLTCDLYSDINWVIMDYLVSEGYPGAAEKFAQETNLCQPADIEGIRERVRIRNAIHAGRIDEAISSINEVDPEVR